VVISDALLLEGAHPTSRSRPVMHQSVSHFNTIGHCTAELLTI